MRQGCLPSLPLFKIQGEVTTTNINKNNSIKDKYIPNRIKAIKISQYADVMNFFQKKIRISYKYTKVFRRLEKAAGATINTEKAFALPINQAI